MFSRATHSIFAIWRRTPPQQRVVSVLAVLLLIDSFVPWYRLTWVVTRYNSGQTTHHTNGASAWQSSTSWSIAVLLCMVAAVGWVTFDRYAGSGVGMRRRWRAGFPAVAAVGLVLATLQWLAIPSVNARSQLQMTIPSNVGTPDAASQPKIGDIVRDQLDSRELNVDWGFFAGIFVMAMLLVALVAIHAHEHRKGGLPPSTKVDPG